MVDDKILRVLNPKNFVDPNNPMKIEAIRDMSGDKDDVVLRNPHYATMSYYAKSGRKYKDFSSFLKKFRCKKCKVYGKMAALSMKDKPNMVEALLCTNCNFLAPLEHPVDKYNLGSGTSGIDKRPTIVGKATKFKMPISESQKLGISKALKKNSPEYLRQQYSRKTHLLNTSLQDSPTDNSMMKIIHKHLRRANLPMPIHSTVKSVYDADDPDFNNMMEGKGIVKEILDYNKPADIEKRTNLVNMLY